MADDEEKGIARREKVGLLNSIYFLFMVLFKYHISLTEMYRGFTIVVCWTSLYIDTKGYSEIFILLPFNKYFMSWKFITKI